MKLNVDFTELEKAVQQMKNTTIDCSKSNIESKKSKEYEREVTLKSKPAVKEYTNDKCTY